MPIIRQYKLRLLLSLIEVNTNQEKMVPYILNCEVYMRNNHKIRVQAAFWWKSLKGILKYLKYNIYLADLNRDTSWTRKFENWAKFRFPLN